MASSPPSRLTPLQKDLLAGFFARERRFFLTGGGALAGFYFGHRDTEDLDLFSAPGPDLAEATQALVEASDACGARLTAQRTYRDFRRFIARRGTEECLVDLVIDRAPALVEDKPSFGDVRVDALREIAANKICTLLARSEIKDLVDLRALVEAGIDLEQALVDARQKDAGVEIATLAWILDELRIGPEARLPGNTDPAALEKFRLRLVEHLSRLAFEQAQRKR
jgi:predicted nucleotidyltransferase component of viral defense system